MTHQISHSSASISAQEWTLLAQSFFGASSDAIAITKSIPNGREIVYVNEAFLEMLGYESREALGEFDDFWDLTAGPEAMQELQKRLQAQERFTVRMDARRADGSLLAIDLTAMPVLVGDTRFVIGSAAQVTERPLLLEPSFVVCGYCENVRDPEGPWTNMRTLVQTTNSFTVSHGICPVCFPAVKATTERLDP